MNDFFNQNTQDPVSNDNNSTNNNPEVVSTNTVMTPEPVQVAPVQKPVMTPEPVQVAPVQEPVMTPEPVQAGPVQEPVVAPEPVQAGPVQEPVMTPEPVQVAPVQEPVTTPEPIQAGPVQEPVMTTEPVQPPVGVTTTPIEADKKKKNILPIIIIVILLLGAAGFGAYKLLMKAVTPKQIFMSAIDNIYTKVSDVNSKTNMEANVDLSWKLAGPTFSEADALNNFKASFKLLSDNTKNEVSLDIYTAYKNSDLLKANLYLTDEKLYATSSDLMDYYVYTKLDENVTEPSITIDDISKVFNEIENALDLSLKDSYFTKTEETINVNGQDIKTTKSSLVLDQTFNEEFNNNFYNTLLGSEKFLNVYAKISQQTVSEVKDELNQMKNEPSSDSISTTNIYTKGSKHEFVKFEAISTTDEGTTNITVTNNGNGEYVASVISNGETVEFYFKKTADAEKTNYEVRISLNGDTITLYLGTSIKYDETVKMPTVLNSYDIETITEDQLNDILMRLYSNEGVLNLVQNLSELTQGI